MSNSNQIIEIPCKPKLILIEIEDLCLRSTKKLVKDEYMWQSNPDILKFQYKISL